MKSETLERLYRETLRFRRVEEKIAEVYPEQQIRCPVHLAIGQEAIAAGVCCALLRSDFVLSAHRSHGHYLAKGGSLPAMMNELYGKANGCAQGKGGSMHLIDVAAGFLGAVPVVGSTIPIAVGVALATQLRGEDHVTCVFFGDAATEEGVFHEAVNFAVVKRLPIVFVCENNLYSVYSPLSVRQPPGREIWRLAKAYGLESCAGDGNDVTAVYEMAGRAIGRARSGGGPSFLEFKTYRWLEHVGPEDDDKLGYRPAGELEAWKARDPLPRMRSQMLAAGFAPERLDAMLAEIDAEIDAALVAAKEAPFPEPQSWMNHIYAS